MGVLNFWAPGSQGVKMQEGNGVFGQLITKNMICKTKMLSKALTRCFFFLLYCQPGIVNFFHRLAIVNAADN